MAGWRASSASVGRPPAGAGEVALGHQCGAGRPARLAQRLLPPGAPVGPGRHVARPGHGADRAPAAGDEVGDCSLGPADVVGVDVADRGPISAPSRTSRRPARP